MHFNLTLFPLDGDTSLRESAADLRAEIDDAGLRYNVTGSETIVEARWDELAPVLKRAEDALRLRHNRVCMVLSVENQNSNTNRVESVMAAIERDSGNALAP